MRQGKNTMDMTAGLVVSQLLLFAVPIMVGELFQQFYNTADTAIVGKFLGPEALAAVGATSNVTKMMIGFSVGTSLGCTVAVAREFGARAYDRLRTTVRVIMNLSMAVGIILSVLGVLITPLMLYLLRIPEDVYPLALLYLRIYFAGMIFMVLYNTATAILRAVGDSRHPLVFLIASSLLNIALDLLFVAVMHTGVGGAAAATILSQGIAAFFCMLMLLRTEECYRWEPRGRQFDGPIIGEILSVGIPVALQKSITSFSNAIIVSFFSVFGSPCLAGWAVYLKLTGFLITADQSLASSTTTFVSQNIGARNLPRVRRGVRDSVILAVVLITAFSAALWLGGSYLVSLFGDDPGMTEYALLFLRTVLPFYSLQAVHTIMAGGLRGMGRARESTFIMLLNLVILRQVYLFVITRFINTPPVIAMSFPFAWVLDIIMLVLCYAGRVRQLDKEFRAAGPVREA